MTNRVGDNSPQRGGTRRWLRLCAVFVSACLLLASGNFGQEQKPAAEKKAEPAKPVPVPNPLEESLKQLFQRKQVPARPQPAVPPNLQPRLPIVPNAKSTRERTTTERGVAIDAGHAALMRRAQSHIQAKEWREAIELLQRICEPPRNSTGMPEDSLHRADDKRWISLRGEAQRLIGTAPARELRDYQQQYEGRARQLLQEAERTNDLSLLGRIVTTYLQTPAGYEAANRLAALHVDRGEFGLAARYFGILWQIRPAFTADSLWRLKAAYALRLAGDKELSEQIGGELAEGNVKQIEVGGKSVDVAKWLAAAAELVAPVQAALADWPLLFGNASRTGTAQGGEPLLLPRWSRPLAESAALQNQIQNLVEDLADQGSAPLPVIFPIMVGDKVVYRTLHGVEVVDAKSLSGQWLWNTNDEVSVEQGLSGGAIPRWNGRVLNNGAVNAYYGGASEYHPLANLLFRNANFGVISSDGRQLFVLDDQTLLSPRQPGQPNFDPNSQLALSPANKLTAYHLETGRPLWEIGGDAYGEKFDLSLAGHFFFGAPLVDGGDLYIVGERDSLIRLHALDPRTGKPRWSQLIAVSDTKIEADVGRRWLPAQVAAGSGVLVCPTSVGWLTAIDRATQTILWANRIATPNPNQNNFNDGNLLVPQLPLSARWSPSPPVISGDKVIYTPIDTTQESQHLVCWNLFTGKELWRKPRGNGIYLAGVFDGRVVLVGRDAVTALSLENGTQTWGLQSTPPAGRGIAVADRYYLPLASGEVWSIELKTGKVAGKLYLPSGAGALGNLSMYRGMLLSLSPHSLTAFEQREAIQSQIAERKSRNPKDAWALIREAQIAASRRDYVAAHTALQQIDKNAVPSELVERHHALAIETLSAVVRSGNLTAETEATVLGELLVAATAADEKLAFQRLLAERHVARKDYAAAFDAYMGLAESHRSAFIPLDDQPHVQVRADAWLAGRMFDLWQSAPEAARQGITQKVQTLANAVGSQSVAKREEFVRLFAFHSSAIAVRQGLVESHAERGEFLLAEQQLTQLRKNSDRAVAAAATERLAKLMVAHKIADDTSPAATLDWPRQPLRMERIGANYTNHYVQDLSNSGSRLPYFRSHRLQLAQQEQRFEVVDSATDSLIWSLPLRVKSGTAENMAGVAQTTGHFVVLLHRGVLHALSPVDRRVLWTHTLENRLGLQNFYVNSYQSTVQPLRTTLTLTNRISTAQGIAATAGSLSLSNSEYVCYQGRRTLTVLDALTGETRWRFDGVQPGTVFFGDDDVLYLRTPTVADSVALRAIDGKRIDVPKLGEHFTRAAQVVGRGILFSTVSTTSPTPPSELPGKPHVTLRLIDPLKNDDVWKAELATGTLMSQLPGDRLALLDPATGSFQSLDLRTGEIQTLGSVSTDDLKNRTEMFAVADFDNVYLIVNSPLRQNNVMYSESMPLVRVNGILFAFPRGGSKPWQTKIDGQGLILDRLDHSPLLVLTARKSNPRGNVPIMSRSVIALDKFTGEKVLDETTPLNTDFRSLLISLPGKYVELRSYNERLRFSPANQVGAVDR